MSSVTRLHLLSRSMLNVSCQKQKHCSFPLTLTDSSMEFVGQPRPSEACNLLAVPGLSCLDVDEDEGEVVIGIRPKSSPLPRRKSSVTDEDSEPEPPPCGSRRVSFADAKGLSLVQVKEFDTWDVPKLPGYDTPDGEDRDAVEYYLSSFTFFRPLSSEELFNKVLEQKVELETIELLPGTTIVKGVIRVLNISYSKAVFIRTTLDEWSTHFDLLAEYVPGSSDGVMDCFSFKLTLVPPFGNQGARVDFCLRYETPVGTFWSNNNDRNYVLFCHHRMKEEKENPLKENVNKKSCLKTVSPNISPVENKSSKQGSSEENISTDEPNNEVEIHQMKAESPSRTSEENKQELLMEKKPNSSRRRHRKAAQLARVRDYFAQRNGGANDSDRDESHPEIKQATQEGTQREKRADMHSYSTGNSKSECTQLAFEALETSSELRRNVAYDRPTSEDVEKSDPATLAPVESATDIPDKQSADEPASAKQQNISELVRKSEESTLNEDVSYAHVDNTKAVSCESLVSPAGTFTFGTVVAPLYHQVFSRAGSERQRAGSEENPLDTGDFNPYFEQRQTDNNVPTEIKNNSNVQVNLIDDRDSNHSEITQNSTDTTQNPAETEQGIVQEYTNKSKGPNLPFGDTLECPDAVNLLCNTDLLTSQSQGETHLDNLTQDLHKQTAEPQQCQPPEQTCAQIVASVDGQSETLDGFKPVWSVSEHFIKEIDQQTSSTVENNCDHAEVSCDTVSTETTSKPSSSFRENKLLEKLEDFISNHVNNTVTERSVNSLDSCEPEKSNRLTLETSLESQKETNTKGKGNKGIIVSHKNDTENKSIHEVAELMTHDLMSNDHSQSDMFLQLKVQDTLEKTEHCNMGAGVSKQDEDFWLTDTNVLKNWEMMVEEEENAILTNEEQSELINENAKDAEVLEKDATERKTEEVEKMDNAVAVEEKEWIREEETVDTEAIKDAKLDYVKVIETEKTFSLEKTAEEEKKEETEEAERQKEKHLGDIQQVSGEKTKVQDEEGVKADEKMEMNHKGEAGVEQEHHRELQEEKKEEQISNRGDENTVIETGEAEIVEADFENKGNEVDYFQERSDITQSKVVDGLSALVSNGLEVEKEYTKEEQYENIMTGFPSDEDVTQDRSKTNKHPALDGDMIVSTDEPESDQTCHDSASAESDSDDEVELYMHCLRAVGASTPAHKDRIKDAGLTVSKRPSISRGKLPSTLMPSIRESLDEEQHVSINEESHDDMKTAASTAPSVSSGQESSNQNVVWWKETFSCSNISKTLLYTTLLVIFLVVAYNYDFLACFGLYLISVVWLCRQGDEQPGKKDNRAD